MDAFLYDGQYASYLDIFNCIKKYSKNSTLTTWERNVPIYFFNPFLDQKVRFREGDYVIIEISESLFPGQQRNILVSVVHKDEFEENYEVISGTN